MSRRYQPTLLTTFLLMGAVGCSQPPQPQVVSETAIQKANSAKDALFEKLSSRLMEVVSSDGPVQAIQVCSQEAAQIAGQVSKEHGVQISRTALRLRNPDNSAPQWTKGHLDITRTKPQYLPLEDGAVGAILPIVLKPQCLACHGPQDQLAPGVAEKLAELYPSDKATGFKEGDLRGWFVVKVGSPK